MGWSIGYDENWRRDIGYGVPATCDHPGCGEVIVRGLAYVCGGEPFGGERGCGLYFCGKHLHPHERLPQLCERCAPRRKKPFEPTPDRQEWIHHKLTDESWQQWRDENPKELARLMSANVEVQRDAQALDGFGSAVLRRLTFMKFAKRPQNSGLPAHVYAQVGALEAAAEALLDALDAHENIYEDELVHKSAYILRALIDNVTPNVDVTGAGKRRDSDA